jgi:hypothetical protein
LFACLCEYIHINKLKKEVKIKIFQLVLVYNTILFNGCLMGDNFMVFREKGKRFSENEFTKTFYVTFSTSM